MQKAIIIQLEGVLSDDSKRRHLIEPELPEHGYIAPWNQCPVDKITLCGICVDKLRSILWENEKTIRKNFVKK